MPYIDITTNVNLNSEQLDNIKHLCGRAISLIPGKSEQYLMVKISDKANLWFQGDDSAAAMVGISLFGKASREGCESLTKEICGILEREADIPPQRTYVKYQFIDNWGFNKFMF